MPLDRIRTKRLREVAHLEDRRLYNTRASVGITGSLGVVNTIVAVQEFIAGPSIVPGLICLGLASFFIIRCVLFILEIPERKRVRDYWQHALYTQETL